MKIIAGEEVRYESLNRIQKAEAHRLSSAFLVGGFLAAAFPVVYMMVKAEEMTALAGNPINILMSANWQMMAMLNILISICGACMMYHTEYADNGMQKMSVLPIRQGSMFFGKFLIACFGIIHNGGHRNGSLSRLCKVLVSKLCV